MDGEAYASMVRDFEEGRSRRFEREYGRRRDMKMRLLDMRDAHETALRSLLGEADPITGLGGSPRDPLVSALFGEGPVSVSPGHPARVESNPALPLSGAEEHIVARTEDGRRLGLTACLRVEGGRVSFCARAFLEEPHEEMEQEVGEKGAEEALVSLLARRALRRSRDEAVPQGGRHRRVLDAWAVRFGESEPRREAGREAALAARDALRGAGVLADGPLVSDEKGAWLLPLVSPDHARLRVSSSIALPGIPARIAFSVTPRNGERPLPGTLAHLWVGGLSRMPPEEVAVRTVAEAQACGWGADIRDDWMEV